MRRELAVCAVGSLHCMNTCDTWWNGVRTRIGESGHLSHGPASNFLHRASVSASVKWAMGGVPGVIPSNILS